MEPTVKLEHDGNVARIVYDGHWITVLPNGDGQLTVVINSESAGDRHHDDEGNPLLQVLLNDATLYDGEPPEPGTLKRVDPPGDTEYHYAQPVVSDDGDEEDEEAWPTEYRKVELGLSCATELPEALDLRSVVDEAQVAAFEVIRRHLHEIEHWFYGDVTPGEQFSIDAAFESFVRLLVGNYHPTAKPPENNGMAVGSPCPHCGLEIRHDQPVWHDGEKPWHYDCINAIIDDASGESLSEWIITRTPDDPALDVETIVYALNALDALDRWADGEQMARYSDCMYGLTDSPDPGLVGYDAEREAFWAIHSNYTVWVMKVDPDPEVDGSKQMVATFDVAHLTSTEKRHLAMEVAVQAEASERHKDVNEPVIEFRKEK